MTWIKRQAPDQNADVAKVLEELSHAYPPEYDQKNRAQRKVPDLVKNDSIILSHSLIPEAMRHVFRGYAAMLDASLPLSRRQQEMIATTVATLNRCFY
jgi:hypothetical protein